MVERVKFRQGVTEEVRKHVDEYMLETMLYEADTGQAASMASLFRYLTDNWHRAVFHAYGIEIVPIDEWIKEELASYAGGCPVPVRNLLTKHLAGCGFPPEKVKEWMDA